MSSELEALRKQVLMWKEYYLKNYEKDEIMAAIDDLRYHVDEVLYPYVKRLYDEGYIDYAQFLEFLEFCERTIAEIREGHA